MPIPVSAGSPRRSRFELPRLDVSDGTLAALKWLAVGLMTLDHVNKYLLHGASMPLFALGRLALPLFAFVLAFNLARTGALAGGVHRRIAVRLLFFGAMASVPFIALGGLAGGWWPLNIMATLLVATGVIYLVDRGGLARVALATLLFIVGGVLVEFWWPAIGFAVAAWVYVRRPSWPALLAWLLFTVTLTFNGWAFAHMPLVNAGLWALAAFPVIFAAERVRLAIPRFSYAFYVYYPLHLAVLWALRRVA